MDRKILEKAKKLQALVERGEMGEALAAKRALDALCSAWEKILRIMRMSEQLEDVSFLKGIE